MCRRKSNAMQSIEALCASQNLSADRLSAKAKLLLGSYRRVCWASQGYYTFQKDDYLISDDEVDSALDYLLNFSPDEDRRQFERKLKSLFDAKWMMELVDEAMIQVREFPDMGNTYFEVISKFYLSKYKYGETELLDLLNMERSTYYDRKKEAVLVFAWALWGTVLPKTLALLKDADCPD